MTWRHLLTLSLACATGCNAILGLDGFGKSDATSAQGGNGNNIGGQGGDVVGQGGSSSSQGGGGQGGAANAGGSGGDPCAACPNG